MSDDEKPDLVTVRRDDLEACLGDAEAHLDYWGDFEKYVARLKAALDE